MPNRNIVKGNIGNALHSVAPDHITAVAEDVFDEGKQMYQNDINSSQQANVGYFECNTAGDIAAKEVAASGYVLNPGGSIKVKMVNINSANNVTLNINSTGAKTLYYEGERASNTNTWNDGETIEIYYDGTNFYANNVAGGSGSGDGAFDVSAKYPTSGVEEGNTYTLEGALSVLNTNLPIRKKKGGMSIKFIQSSDNKYVQYRLMANSFTTDISQWQGADYTEKLIKEQIRPLLSDLSGYTILGNGTWSEDQRYNCAFYPINNSDELIIIPNSNQCYYALLTDKPNPVNGQIPPYATGYIAWKGASKAKDIEIPSDAKYLLFLKNANTTDMYPQNVLINGIDILKTLQNINEENADSISWSNDISDFIRKYPNLFNKRADDISYGYYIQGGNLNSDSNFNVSGYIPISEIYQYCHKVYSYFGNTKNRVCCYDKNKVFLGITQGIVTDDINVFTPLLNTAFVRVNTKVEDMDTYMLVKGSIYPSSYIPYGIQVDGVNGNIFSPLWGKKLCCDGDSIMHGAAQGGVSNGGFAKPIADRFGMVLQNIAVPGGTIRSNTYWDEEQQTPRHWICDSLATLDTDGDYYIFEGGVNDVGSSAVMGTISWGYTANLDTTTFCGAMEKCCKTLVETFKGKKCGFVFVHRLWQPTDKLASSFFENQKAILKKWGIPFIDLMELAPALNLIDDLKNTYTNNADGWHPNKLGYATYYVPKIIAWLESL